MAIARPSLRTLAIPAAIVAGLGLAAFLFVAASLRRPAPPMFAPTAPSPREMGAGTAGPAQVTIDATDQTAWRRFDFSRGAVVEGAGPLEWDLAVRRTEIIANGGPGFAGRGGIRDLGEVPFTSLRAVPAEGYEINRIGRDTLNPAIDDWYDYGFTTHVLTPLPRVYAIRTADGRYAKIQILGYYCPGARAGCLTFRYVYQGDGSNRVTPDASAPAGDPAAPAPRPPPASDPPPPGD